MGEKRKERGGEGLDWGAETKVGDDLEEPRESACNGEEAMKLHLALSGFFTRHLLFIY